MAVALDPYRLSSPRIFLVRMLVFLILAGFVALILYRQIISAFMKNPGLNGLILGVLIIGILLAFRQVIRLFREIRWVNNHRPSGERLREPEMPVMLAPMATILGEKGPNRAISTGTLRVILDSIATRLDEGREINRYLTGLLIFLGLLGTFWGLLETVGSISDVIKSMNTGGKDADSAVMFDTLKSGLAAPIAGMSISFTSSLFGLAGSLVLGFLDLQAGQAQNRFYNELEDNLSATATDGGAEAPGRGVSTELRATLDRLSASADAATSRASTAAMANLAEGVQGLVQHMRSEQQMIRTWVEAQADQQNEIRKLLQRLNSETLRR
jgi:hypothetical protein